MILLSPSGNCSDESMVFRNGKVFVGLENGKLEFLGGKQELIRTGAFEDVQMAMMCHTVSEPR